MGIDTVSAQESNSQLARRLASKKNEVIETEAGLMVQKQRVESEGKDAISQAIDKNEDNLISISKEGAKQAENVRAQQHAQLQNLNQNSQEHYEKISKDTADRIKALDTEAALQISNHQRASLEKLAYIDNRAEDPFYRLKSFDASMAVSEKEYRLDIKLPAHEAQNLFVAADGSHLKLSLARSYEGKENLEDGRQNRTYSYQTILENVALPGHPDMSKVERSYADGKLTIRIAKLI